MTRADLPIMRGGPPPSALKALEPSSVRWPPHVPLAGEVDWDVLESLSIKAGRLIPLNRGPLNMLTCILHIFKALIQMSCFEGEIIFRGNRGGGVI